MLTRFRALFLVLLAAAVVVGCPSSSRQPELRDAKVTPNVLTPGDSGLITVQVKDKFGIVDRIVVMANEQQNITFDLHDDGLNGDAKANDGIWSFWVEVPINAPPGDYAFTMTAYSKDGNVILTRSGKHKGIPLAASFTCTIQEPGKATENAPASE